MKELMSIGNAMSQLTIKQNKKTGEVIQSIEEQAKRDLEKHIPKMDSQTKELLNDGHRMSQINFRMLK